MGNCIANNLLPIASRGKVGLVAAEVSPQYFCSVNRACSLRLATETHEIIQVEQIRPGPDIFARLAEFGHILREEP